jgi:8-oxo-dGTP pyrophosphatase MutT (NUDIX family)
MEIVEAEDKKAKLEEIERLKKRLEELGVRTVEREGVFVLIFHPRYPDQILFVQHNNDGKWSLPGGGIKQAEHALDAAKREVLEETGLEVKISPDPIAHLTFELKYGFFLLFSAEDIKPGFLKNILANGNGKDTLQCKFFHVDNLPQPIYNAQKGSIGWMLSYRGHTQYGHPNKPPIAKYRTENQ